MYNKIGIGARALQLGIRQAPLTYYPLGYVYSGGFWLGVGYYYDGWVEQNGLLLERRMRKLKETRESGAALELKQED
ncbi:hypothetical protein CANARDRAFT_28325 [[Candida] arabinofermentans NRRL YB-2248]|uniref:Uncharacterized protein n=1 Tax=[Candida] arabinofermentans NRRL YB-2248 TaxID=983967 RepID=A0A1E4T1B6_9ASCO|nr:hypothetical protein CANARDRAFT_28325 [[Candida] arabinofermentans NRRL YB-2248]